MGRSIAAVLVTIGVASSTFAQQSDVPFTVCAQSYSWTRPGPDVQSKIWNDNRYKPVGPTSVQWTHRFLLNEPDSASITYHNENLSGLWTDIQENQCPRRDEQVTEWFEIWALEHHVTLVTSQGSVYTVTVEPRDLGYEIIQFHRPRPSDATLAMLRFVSEPGGIVVDEWREARLGLFVPVSGRR
jgi:hypothetical protein